MEALSSSWLLCLICTDIVLLVLCCSCLSPLRFLLPLLFLGCSAAIWDSSRCCIQDISQLTTSADRVYSACATVFRDDPEGRMHGFCRRIFFTEVLGNALVCPHSRKRWKGSPTLGTASSPLLEQVCGLDVGFWFEWIDSWRHFWPPKSSLCSLVLGHSGHDMLVWRSFLDGPHSSTWFEHLVCWTSAWTFPQHLEVKGEAEPRELSKIWIFHWRFWTFLLVVGHCSQKIGYRDNDTGCIHFSSAWWPSEAFTLSNYVCISAGPDSVV